MLEDFFLPVWVAPFVLILFFALFFIRKATSVKKLTFWDFITPALHAVMVTSFLVLGINLFYAWAIERVKLPTLIEPLDPSLSAGILLIALAMWFIYQNMKGIKRSQRG
jgi:hypothetical protein